MRHRDPFLRVFEIRDHMIHRDSPAPERWNRADALAISSWSYLRPERTWKDSDILINNFATPSPRLHRHRHLCIINKALPVSARWNYFVTRCCLINRTIKRHRGYLVILACAIIMIYNICIACSTVTKDYHDDNKVFVKFKLKFSESQDRHPSCTLLQV